MEKVTALAARVSIEAKLSNRFLSPHQSANSHAERGKVQIFQDSVDAQCPHLKGPYFTFFSHSAQLGKDCIQLLEQLLSKYSHKIKSVPEQGRVQDEMNKQCS